jgi:anti-sigma factor RsiW
MNRRHLSEAELTDFADQLLAPDRHAAAETHLAVCSVCAERLARVRSAAEAVWTLRAVAPPDDLAARTRERLLTRGVREINCGQAAPLLSGHLDRALSPASALALARHLRACPRCAAELDALSAMSRLVRSLPAVAAPARIRREVDAARRTRDIPVPWGARLRPALAAAFAGAALVGVVFLRGATRPTAPPDEPRVTSESPPAARPTLEVADAREEPTRLEEAAAGDQVEPSAGAEERPRVAERVARARPELTSHVVVPSPRGPVPAPVVAEASVPSFALPAALRTLEVVASTVADEMEWQSELELAGERFATMNSEAMWAQLPDLPAPAEGEEDDADAGASVIGPAEGEEPEEVGGASPPSSSAPMREGALSRTHPLASRTGESISVA